MQGKLLKHANMKDEILKQSLQHRRLSDLNFKSRFFNTTSCVFHATKFKRNGVKTFQSRCMLINKGIVIRGGVYYSSMMTKIPKPLVISLRDYLKLYPHEPTVNIVLITKDHQEASKSAATQD